MNLRDFLLEGLLVFTLALCFVATLTYLWSRLLYGGSAVDWPTSVALALALSVAIPVVRTALRRDKHGQHKS
jgi:hypothetical protein